MTLKNKLKNLIKDNGDIQIASIEIDDMNVNVILPYETGEVCIELEGTEDEEILNPL